jgi:N-methylhydantoinase B
MFGIFDDDGRPHPEKGTFGNGTLTQTCHLVAFPVKAGQIYRYISAGAGGFGDPLERDPQRVLRDVVDERVSIAQARDSYGVVVARASLAIDVPATEDLRAELRRKRRAGEWQAPRSYFRGWPLNSDQLAEVRASSVAGPVRLGA